MRAKLESAPAISAMTRGDAKSLILQILAEEWPLSAKDVHNRLRARHGPSITYQGVHKILGQLVLDDAVAHENKQYSLRLDWIRGLRKFGEAAEKKYLAQDVQKPYLEVGVGSSVERDAFSAGREAAEKALKQIKYGKPLQLALIFTSRVYEDAYDKLLAGVRAVTKNAPLTGCSTFGEIANRPLTKSVVVMVFSADSAHFSAQTICLPVRPEQYDTGAFADTVAQLKRQLAEGGEMPELGLLFVNGYTKSNNLRTVTPSLLNQLVSKTKFPFPIIGGVAGDDWNFERTAVFCGSKVHKEAIVLAAVRTRLKFGIGAKHSYSPVSQNKYKIRLKDNIVTDMAKMEKGKAGKWLPCPATYLKEAGISAREFRGILSFMKEIIAQNKALPLKNIENHLLAFPFDVKDNGITFQNLLSDGDVVQIMHTTTEDLERTCSESLEEAVAKLGSAPPTSALLFSCSIFECILSNRHRNEIAPLKKTKFKSLPIVGCYVAGEVWPFTAPQASGSVVAVVFGNELRG
ncbi:MAG: FIST N-terminal domain-containing protein [Candidatus Burarchaeum sp.]|nr:FIST N-terminal domain-containing protein [Candidatus Burarchaeum sp.]MDO8339689.1 FIST N-terminal domain-containing protein [Candidatus Burarchaeum sp.]